MKERIKKVYQRGSVVYGLGFLGAAVYYIQHAPNFAMGLLGILKAVFWPAILTYKAMETMHI